MKKVLLTGITVMAVTSMLIYVGLTLKLIMLGNNAYSGDIGPVWMPFGHIEVNSSGFSVENKLGSVVVPVLAGGLVVLAGWWRKRRSQPAN